MNGTITWCAITILCAACAVGLGGCGGAEGGSGIESHRVIPDGYTAISFTAGGQTNSAVSHSLESALLDASDTGTGTGTGVGGPTSVFDGLMVSCAFTVGTTTAIQHYTTTTDISNCPNKNECIVCTPTAAASDCGITCDGVVPSSAASASDTFDVFVTFTSTIETDMPDPYGTIRFDAERTGTSFNLSTTSLLDDSGCTYSPGDHKLGLSPIAANPWFTSLPGNYRKGFIITNIDPDAGNSNKTSCIAIRQFNATPTLIGADTPGTTVTNNLGTVTFRTKICDYEDSFAVAHTLSVCTE